jgi:hypothetical protein
MAYIHHIKISDQYTKALDEGDFDTVARINSEIPNLPVEMIEVTLLIHMGGHSERIYSLIKSLISVIFGVSESDIKLIKLKGLKQGYYPIQIPLSGKRTVGELIDKEVEDLLKLPYCGVTNIYFNISDGSQLYCRKKNIPTTDEWEQKIKKYQEMIKSYIGKSSTNYENLLIEYCKKYSPQFANLNLDKLI